MNPVSRPSVDAWQLLEFFRKNFNSRLSLGFIVQHLETFLSSFAPEDAGEWGPLLDDLKVAATVENSPWLLDSKSETAASLLQRPLSQHKCQEVGSLTESWEELDTLIILGRKTMAIQEKLVKFGHAIQKFSCKAMECESTSKLDVAGQLWQTPLECLTHCGAPPHGTRSGLRGWQAEG